jgi:hypothetical protein
MKRATVHLEWDKQSWWTCGKITQPEPKERNLKNDLVFKEEFESIGLREATIYPVSTTNEKLVA